MAEGGVTTTPTQAHPQHSGRGRILTIAGGASLLSLLLCGMLGTTLWRVTSKTETTPSEAADAYFRALRSRNPERVSEALCGVRQSNAGRVIEAFYRNATKGSGSVQDIRWAPVGAPHGTGGAQRLRTQVTVVVEHGGATYSRRAMMELALVKEGWRGWRVCPPAPTSRG
jgi:hypothetical protein